MGDSAKRDANFVPVLIGVSSADGVTPLPLKVDAVTGRLLAYAQQISATPLHAVQPGKRDPNKRPVLMGQSSSDNTPIPLSLDGGYLRIKGA